MVHVVERQAVKNIQAILIQYKLMLFHSINDIELRSAPMYIGED